MSTHSPGSIERFVALVRRRVNSHRLWTALLWGVVAGLALLSSIGVVYVALGFAVPRGAYLAAAALAAAVAGGVWLCARLNVDQSARFVDRFYSLHEAVASYLHFSRANRRDGFYALQAAQTERSLARLSPEAIAYHPPRRGLLMAAGLIAVALPLSLREPSAAVLERQRIEEATEAFMAAAKPELEEIVEKLAHEVDDPLERELVDPEQLRKWVDQLDPTRDQKEALKQFAQLERKLNRARLATQSRREEQLLARAAEELQKQPETRPMGSELADKKYDKAAEKLGEMAPEPGKPASQARKSLARLKAAAQRMAAAAKASRAAAGSAASATQSKSGNSSSKNASGSASTAQAEGSPSSSDGGELSENLEQLESSVAELDEALQEAEKQEKQYGKCDSEAASQCQACQNKVQSQVNKLCKSLGKLAIRRKAESKLESLCKACSQCQGGLCQAACDKPGAKPGGKNAGWGSNLARRDEQDAMVDNGQTTQLQGIQGAGPSLSTVEEADDGSGVSTRTAKARDRKFTSQVESFVQREDVPEPIKRGVKNYFQLIHQMEQTPVPADGQGE